METNERAVMMIEFGVTRQPKEYQSVRCGVTLPVFVKPWDDVQEMLQAHLEAAKWTVRSQVDDEFEKHGRPAPYSLEPRYMLLVASQEKVCAIVPEAMKENLPEKWQITDYRYEGHRLAYILQHSLKEQAKYRLIDATNGNLDLLPELGQFCLFTNKGAGLWVLAKDSDDRWSRSEQAQAYPDYFRSNGHLRVYREAFLAELREKAAKEGAELFDCTDGDFSKLPAPLAQKPEPDEGSEDNDDYMNEEEENEGGDDD